MYQDDLMIARNAANGDPSAREAISHLVHPLIQYKTSILCKRYCFENHHHYRCTVDFRWGVREADAPLCDWGNHSYAWMLEDLTSPQSLLRYRGDRNAKLTTYFSSIVNSLMFFERWKDDRFGRRVRAPTYVRDISPSASKIFMWLKDAHPIEQMAQKLNASIEEVERIVDQIILELTERNKLHLLDSTQTISITGLGGADDEEGDEAEGDIPDFSWDPVEEQMGRLVADGWNELTPVEQFVLKALVVEDQKAADVLQALRSLGISLKEGVSAEDIDRQQLYYFKRVALAKLAKLSGIEGDDS
jgi:hypothetical protein